MSDPLETVFIFIGNTYPRAGWVSYPPKNTPEYICLRCSKIFREAIRHVKHSLKTKHDGTECEVKYGANCETEKGIVLPPKLRNTGTLLVKDKNKLFLDQSVSLFN